MTAPIETSNGMSPRRHNIISYTGACVLLPVMFLLGGAPNQALLPTLLWTLHFTRRAAESAFIHRYSGRPVPPSDYLVEYAYYWGFAVWIGYALTAPTFSLPAAAMWPATAVFVLGELGNARCHWILRQLRHESGDTTKQIPQGFGFRLVSCPHYLFEIVSWLGFALLCQVTAVEAFLVVGSVILGVYAHQRHKQYRKEFDGYAGRAAYPSKRRALVPFVF